MQCILGSWPLKQHAMLTTHFSRAHSGCLIMSWPTSLRLQSRAHRQPSTAPFQMRRGKRPGCITGKRAGSLSTHSKK